MLNEDKAAKMAKNEEKKERKNCTNAENIYKTIVHIYTQKVYE